MKLKLSPLERVLLINQFEIRKAVEKNKHDVEWFEEMIEVLERGYEAYYSQLTDRFSSFAEEDSRFVVDVLDMYRCIEDYKVAHPNDVEVAEAPYSFFFGFDGNNEAQHLGFVRFLFEKKELWKEQAKYAEKTDDYNNHMPTLDTYGRMLAKFKSFGEHVTKLSHDQVLAVLAEAKHPANK